MPLLKIVMSRYWLKNKYSPIILTSQLANMILTKKNLIIAFVAVVLLFGSIRLASIYLINPDAPSFGKLAEGTLPNIYTYFDSIGFGQGELDILELWKKSWTAYGWNPVILDVNTAKKHPRFSYYENIFLKYPSVNPAGYDMACYYRWIAMVVVGGGFISDIDVMNYGFTYPKEWDWTFTTHQRFVPCFVSASKEEYQRMLDVMASIDIPANTIITFGKNHTSDMIIFYNMFQAKKLPHTWMVNDITKILTHWSHDYAFQVGGKEKPRAQTILENRYDPLWNKKPEK
jgi:hypothetical protein